MLLAPITARGQEAKTEWNTTDTILQIITTGALAIDRSQTLWIANQKCIDFSHIVTDSKGERSFVGNPFTTNEINPIIGKNASRGRINTYFGTVAITHTLISYGLRKSGLSFIGIPLVNIWQASVITIESAQIGKNISLNIGMKY